MPFEAAGERVALVAVGVDQTRVIRCAARRIVQLLQHEPLAHAAAVQVGGLLEAREIREQIG